METEFEALVSRISNAYDPDELVDMLGISSYELLMQFSELLLENRHLFEEHFDDC